MNYKMDELLHFLGENHLALGIVSFISWSIIYFVMSTCVHNFSKTKPLSKLAKVHISEALVSAVQGFVCGGIGVLAVIDCRHDVLKAQNEAIIHYCTIGTGYFMYDLVAMYYANNLDLVDRKKSGTFLENFKSYLYNNALMIAHHIILTGLLFPALITYSTMGHFFAGCFFCMELSSPFVNFRVILSKMGMKATKLYLYNGIVMMIVFAIFRVLVFAYMYVHYSLQQSSFQNCSVYDAFLKIPLVCHFYCTLILSPQLYWLSMMINGVFSVLAKIPKALDKYD
ncbi:UNVERIFIED_CONTAM: hypothetical protein GTU68_006261 [Idotea baltica]|nr:hypothetical protein [Idotea baltica]